MLDNLLTNPILRIAGAIVGLLALVNNLIGSFGLPAFWSDLLVSSILAFTTLHWGIFVWRGFKNKHTAFTLQGTSEEIVPYGVLLRRLGASIVLLPILICLFVWSAIPLVRHIKHTNWTLCGSFITVCNRGTRLQLIDSRGRQIYSESLGVDDDSGYKSLSAPNWWSYEPKRVILICDGKSSEQVELDSAVFDNTCNTTIVR